MVPVLPEQGGNQLVKQKTSAPRFAGTEAQFRELSMSVPFREGRVEHRQRLATWLCCRSSITVAGQRRTFTGLRIYPLVGTLAMYIHLYHVL
jgi:hypothetical protein